MRLHRFFVAPSEAELSQEFWLKSPSLRQQWSKVLRYKVGDDVVLFDGVAVERLYKIDRIEADATKLILVTEFERKLPSKHVYLFWSLLKKDKNDWVLQKCTELGVSNFVPILAERSEKTGFNYERALRIVTEAAEQCGRSDIPLVREPLELAAALKEYASVVKILVAEESLQGLSLQEVGEDEKTGVLVGPEGGWTEHEIELFSANNLPGLNLGNLTLRAETACVAAATKLLQ